MHLGVAIALRRRGVQKTSMVLACQIKHIDCASRANQQGLDTQPTIVDRAGRRSEVEDVIDPARVKRCGNVLLDELEPSFSREMVDVVPVSGREVVDADHMMSFGEEGVTEMRAEKPCCSRDKNRFGRHQLLPFTIECTLSAQRNVNICRINMYHATALSRAARHGSGRGSNRSTDRVRRSPAYAQVSKAMRRHHLGLIEISSVNHDGIAQRLAQPSQV